MLLHAYCFTNYFFNSVHIILLGIQYKASYLLNIASSCFLCKVVSEHQVEGVPGDSGRSSNPDQRGVFLSIWGLFTTMLVAHHGNGVCDERERERVSERLKEREKANYRHTVYPCGWIDINRYLILCCNLRQCLIQLIILYTLWTQSSFSQR